MEVIMNTLKIEHKNGWQIYINSYTVCSVEDDISFIPKINEELGKWCEQVMIINDYRHVNLLLPYLMKKLQVDPIFPVTVEVIVHDGINSYVHSTTHIL